MNYTTKSTELINWIDRAIDRRKGGKESSKVIIATQTSVLLSGVLRSDCASRPDEEHSYTIYSYARKLLNKLDPELYKNFHQIISQKDSSGGIYNINGVEAIATNNVFINLTKTKAKALKSTLKKLNRDKPSFSNNYQVVESWCKALGLPIDLIRLDNADLDDLDRYLKTIDRDYETANINLLEPNPAV